MAPPPNSRKVQQQQQGRQQQQPQQRVDPQQQQQQQQGAAAPGAGATARKVVGQYMLGKAIGEGTFGKVKLAVHLPTGEKADVRRVNREIKILKKSAHKNVIQLYEVLDTQNSIYLIMENCEGGEMFQYIVQHRHVPEPQACKFFHQIIDGVEALHKSEVTHRDLKPENLLLKASKNGWLVKIVDFGLSNTHEGGKLLGTACGSPCYAAPEMIAGKKYVGPLADMWSLGVILFALVCGFLPFEDQNTSVLYKKILSGEYKPAKWISKDVSDLIRKILETDPTKRYTVSDVRKHRWYQQVTDADIPTDEQSPEDAATIQKIVLDQMREADIDVQGVLDGIKSRACNSSTAMYHLLCQKLRAAKAARPSKEAAAAAAPTLQQQSQQQQQQQQQQPSGQAAPVKKPASQGQNASANAAAATAHRTHMQKQEELLAAQTAARQEQRRLQQQQRAQQRDAQNKRLQKMTLDSTPATGAADSVKAVIPSYLQKPKPGDRAIAMTTALQQKQQRQETQAARGAAEAKLATGTVAAVTSGGQQKAAPLPPQRRAAPSSTSNAAAAVPKLALNTMKVPASSGGTKASQSARPSSSGGSGAGRAGRARPAPVVAAPSNNNNNNNNKDGTCVGAAINAGQISPAKVDCNEGGSQSARAALPDDAPFDFSSFRAGGVEMFDVSSAVSSNHLNSSSGNNDDNGGSGVGRYGSLPMEAGNVDAVTAAIEKNLMSNAGQPVSLGGYGGVGIGGISGVSAVAIERPNSRRHRQRGGARGGVGGDGAESNAKPARPGSAVGGMHMERSSNPAVDAKFRVDPQSTAVANSAAAPVEASMPGLGNPLLLPAHTQGSSPQAQKQEVIVSSSPQKQQIQASQPQQPSQQQPGAPQVPQRSQNGRANAGRAGRHIVNPN
eukprot:GSChrysophyteH2.ASY1.ANO1.584.1 assembled CDS